MKNIPGHTLFQWRNLCFRKKPFLFLPTLPVFFLLAVFSGCDLFTNSLADYFLDNTGIVEVREVAEKPPGYYKMASGTILIPPGSTIIDMFLLNSRNLNFRHQFLGAVPAGRIISAERVESTKLEITVTGAEEGDDYDLTLAMQSPDGLRDFTPHTLRILCVSFEKSLMDLAVKFNGGIAALDQPFNPNITEYTAVVPGAVTEVTLEGTTVHRDAALSINGGSPVVSSLVPGNNGPYVFHVTAPNGIDTKDYRVTVYKGDDSRAITGFTITSPVSAKGTINEDAKTVTVSVPYGTDLTSMTVSLTHTGVSAAPPAGTAQTGKPATFTGQDFTTARTYTITAQDGTTQTYTVTVSVASNPAKAITAFTITGPVSAPGVIDETAKTITVNVPYGTDVTAMTASVSHTGTSISPDPAAAKSYAGPVTYTVTAADDSTQDYTVTVNAALNNAKRITDFIITGPEVWQQGDINEALKTITVNVPYGTNVTGMTALVSHTGASISPEPAAATNYSSPVTYTVMATDGTTQDYTVTVNVAPNNARKITDFAITGPELWQQGDIIEAEKTITVNVPYGTNVTGMTALVSHTGASISPDPAAAKSYAGPVTYTVKAEDGSTQNYRVTVKAALNPARAITAFTITAGPVNATGIINETAKTITVNVPNGTDVTAMTASVSHTGVSITSLPSGAPQTGSFVTFSGQNFTSGSRTYRVTAADGTIQDYTATVNVAANDAKEITAFYFTIGGKNYGAGTGTETGSGSISLNNITITVPYGTDVTNMTASVSHTGASISPEPAMAVDYSIPPVTFTVTAADNTLTQTYTVTVTVAANPAITDIYFTINSKKYGAGTGTESGSGSISGNSIKITVPYGTSVTNMTPTVIHTGASINPVSGTVWGSSNQKTYTVTAADNLTQDYTVIVTVKPGITIVDANITSPSIPVLTFSASQMIVVSPASVIITISGGTVTAWRIYINGLLTSGSPGENKVTFSAPTVPGFYNVNVIATAGGVNYSGSFGLIVQQ